MCGGPGYVSGYCSKRDALDCFDMLKLILDFLKLVGYSFFMSVQLTRKVLGKVRKRVRKEKKRKGFGEKEKEGKFWKKKRGLED